MFLQLLELLTFWINSLVVCLSIKVIDADLKYSNLFLKLLEIFIGLCQILCSYHRLYIYIHPVKNIAGRTPGFE